MQQYAFSMDNKKTYNTKMEPPQQKEPLRHINTFCEKSSSYEAKGICMLLIIFHHIYVQFVTNWNCSIPIIDRILGSGGYLGTGLFFFLSGYGLYHSLSRQQNLKFSYLGQRLSKMLLVYVFAFMIAFLMNTKLDTKELIVNFVTLTLPNTTTWFLKVIFALYIIVFFIFRINMIMRQKLIIVVFLTLVYYWGALVYLPDYWYTSVLCFPVGMIAAHNKSIVKDKIQILASVIFLICFVINHKAEFLFVNAITFSFLVLYLIRYKKNTWKWLKFIGINSICFYLFQLAVLQPLIIEGITPIVYMCSVIGSVVFLSLVYVKWIEPYTSSFLSRHK